MKKVFVLIGVGAIGLLAMSSTCTSEPEGSAKRDKVASAIDVSAVQTPAEGIAFKKMTLEEAKKKATEEGKLIFIDAYTDWCGPCKKMAASTFVDPAVAKYFNENFINIKIEMEKDADGPAAARQYNVRAYPTLLIIDNEGVLVKQTIGFKSAEQLLAFGESALQ